MQVGWCGPGHRGVDCEAEPQARGVRLALPGLPSGPSSGKGVGLLRIKISSLPDNKVQCLLSRPSLSLLSNLLPLRFWDVSSSCTKGNPGI